MTAWAPALQLPSRGVVRVLVSLKSKEIFYEKLADVGIPGHFVMASSLFFCVIVFSVNYEL